MRDEIVQDETFARSAVIDNGASKIGYIFFLSFMLILKTRMVPAVLWM